MNKELFVFLGNTCNFECEHCFTASSPSSKKYIIEDLEAVSLAKEVEANNEITSIHFTGGEPLLFLKKILKFQKFIYRENLKFKITTNGELIQNLYKNKEIKVDEIIFSFDVYHGKYVEKEKILKIAQEAKRKIEKVAISLTLSSIKDFSLVNYFKRNDLEVFIRPLGPGGRQKKQGLEFREEGPYQKKCYLLEDSLSKGEEQLMFMPGRGLIPCCGPLNVDGDARLEYYSPSIEHYDENYLRDNLKERTFGEICQELGVTFKNINNRCEICTNLFGQKEAKQSLFKFLKESNPNKGHPFIPEMEDVIRLKSNWSISHNLKCENPLARFQDKSSVKFEHHVIDNPDEFEKSKIFLWENLYGKFPSFFNKKIFENQLGIFEKIYNVDPLINLNFYDGGMVVGSIFISKVSVNGEFFYNVNFFGVGEGYQDKIKRCELIQFMLGKIKNVEKENIGFGARVNAFNKDSLRFFEKLGFTVRETVFEKNL